MSRSPGDDVKADREPEPGALAGRLGREERLEQLFPELGRDPGAVVAHGDFDLIAEIPGRNLQIKPVNLPSPVRTLIDRFHPLRGASRALFVRVRHRLLSI